MSTRKLHLPTLKQWVAIVLIGSFALFILILVVGLVVPKSTLERFSTSKTTSSGQIDEAQSVNTDGSPVPATSSSQTSDTSQQNQSTTTDTSSSGSPSATGQTGGTSGDTAPPSSGGSTPGTSTQDIAPSLTFSGSPTSVTTGASAVLSWSINANATQPVSCTASGGWSGAKATSGSQSVTPSSTTTYTLTCTNSAGTSGAKSVNISVTAPPVSCKAGGTCTASDVAQHATTADCWMAVTGGGYNKVYVISSSFNTSHRNQTGKNAASTTRTCGKVVSINTLKGYAGDHQNGSTIGGSNFDAWLSSFYYANYQ